MAAKKAVEHDGTQRKRGAGAKAKLDKAEQPKQTSQAEEAFNRWSAGEFPYYLAWHEDCVFDLEEEKHGINLCVFADGSAVRWDDTEQRVLPRCEVFQYLPDVLLAAYHHCIFKDGGFIVWIEGERFAGTPKEVFEAILRLLDAPVEPPKRMLGVIDDATKRIESCREHQDALKSDAIAFKKTARHLISSGILDAASLKQAVEHICKEEQHEQKCKHGR